MAMRSIETIHLDHGPHAAERAQIRKLDVWANEAGMVRVIEQRAAHARRCEARAAINGTPFND